MIAAQSGGIPRNINNLCFNAMSLGCALKRPIVDASIVQEVIGDLDLSTIAVPLEKGDQQASQPSHCSGVDSSSAWRRELVPAIAVLASLVWLNSQVVLPVKEKFLPEHSGKKTSQPETNHSLELGPLPNEEYLGQKRITRIPLSQQTTREFQSAPEQKVVPPEFATQRETP